MPELPEITASAERLHDARVGDVLARFEPLSFTALKTVRPPPEVTSGRTLVRVGHRGKHLLLDFGEATYVVHLMQGGRLRHDAGRSRRPRGGVARWRFADGEALLLTEAGSERRAGVWLVEGDPLAADPLRTLGPEADQVGADALAALLADNPMRLHTFLREQRLMAGIGRRLANEICHRARLSPFARTTALVDRADDLVAAVRGAIADEVAFERSQEDMVRARDRPTRVHGRAGQACPDCGGTVRSVEYRDYTVAYCPDCQTGGKVLADNTTSRFLK